VNNIDALPETGYMRLPHIIGQKPVTEEQARENRKRGKGIKRPRPGIQGVFPVGTSTWWEGVRTGRFPEGYKLGPRTTAWRTSDIRKLIAEFYQYKD